MAHDTTHSMSEDEPIVIGLDHGMKLFKNKSNIQRLIPGGILMVCNAWLPLYSSYSNLKMVLHTQHTTVTFLNATTVSALSFGIAEPANRGISYTFSYYGQNEVNLIKHILSHLIHLKTVLPPNVNVGMFISFPHKFDITKVKLLLTPYLGDSHQMVYNTVKEEALLLRAPIGDSI